jgi:hypothetical protein
VEMAKVALHPENSNGATWEEKARVTDDWSRDRRLAVRLHGLPKKRFRGGGGSQ